MVPLRPIELTSRLMTLAGQVPTGARFADIGTDHARLPVWLLEQGVIDRAIATDLRRGPLERAARTAARHAMTDRISLRLGGGLAPLSSGEVDTVAIAGMGGETIAAILAEAPWVREEGITFLLQPMTSTDALRHWLSDHGYAILQEELVEEGESLYIILTVQFGPMDPLTPAEQWVGRQTQGQIAPLRGAYLTMMTDRAEKALKGIRRSTRPQDEEKRLALEALCVALYHTREEWEQWQQL